MAKKQGLDTERAMLEALAAVPGALRLVTPRRRDDRAGGDPTDPATFVWEGVTGIADHPSKGHLARATTAEGSWVDGTAGDLLVKLQEWRQAAG